METTIKKTREEWEIKTRVDLWKQLAEKEITASARCVYLQLRSYISSEKNFCYPTRQTLMKELGFSKNTIIRSLRELEIAGFIRSEKNVFFIAEEVPKNEPSYPKMNPDEVPKNEPEVPKNEPINIPIEPTNLKTSCSDIAEKTGDIEAAGIAENKNLLKEKDKPILLEFPISHRKNKPASWGLKQSLIDEFAAAFPGVDVLAECKKARSWCISNPKKQKTFDGMPRFLNSWLGKEQNRASSFIPPNEPERKPEADPKIKRFEREIRERIEALPGVPNQAIFISGREKNYLRVHGIRAESLEGHPKLQALWCEYRTTLERFNVPLLREAG